jgi:hypothetical protein
MASPWQPTLAIKATLALHAAALAGCVLVPTLWPWALGVLVVNHAIITTAGLLPRTTLLGPNLTRLPDSAVARREIAITIDDGPDPEVTPASLTCSTPPMPRPPSSASAGAPAKARYCAAKSSLAAIVSRTMGTRTPTPLPALVHAA